MAQHPEKLSWKESHPYGLSASQFGMALGFCGRISDYVNYQRHVVGTAMEFKGNEFTAHGISTEPKSRALYELLTGCRVRDGGFFVTADRILGCSPDGQIDVPADEKPLEQQDALQSINAAPASPLTGSTLQTRTSSSLEEGPRRSSGCSVRVPFKSQRRARSPLSTSTLSRSSVSLSVEGTRGLTEVPHVGGAGEGISSPLMAMALSSSTENADRCFSPALPSVAAPATFASAPPARQRRVRLLEIKSPYRALYDCTKPMYAPFGIPLHYMCQIQGQLAIADCEECDFFVYVEHPRCQVEAWRVRRSRAFWQWAEPSLRLVSEWVKDGPPDWLNRSFAFPPFAFDSIEVLPLVFPFDITGTVALNDARRFAFFAKCASPYETLRRRRGDSRRLGENPGKSADATVQQWCRDACGVTWGELTEYERIALAVQAPVVRHLFEANESAHEEQQQQDTADRDDAPSSGRFVQTLSTWRHILEAEGCYEGSATAILWRSLMHSAAGGRDPLVCLTVHAVEDWEEGRFRITCTMLCPDEGSDEISFVDCVSLSFAQRLFLVSLRPALTPLTVVGAALSIAAPVAARHSYAMPLENVPVFGTARSQ